MLKFWSPSSCCFLKAFSSSCIWRYIIWLRSFWIEFFFKMLKFFFPLLSGTAKAAMKWTQRCWVAAVSSWGAWCEPRCPSRRWCCCCSAWPRWCRRRRKTSHAPWPTLSPGALSPCSATPMVHPPSKSPTQLPIQFLHLETKLIMRTKKNTYTNREKDPRKENFAVCLSSRSIKCTRTKASLIMSILLQFYITNIHTLTFVVTKSFSVDFEEYIFISRSRTFAVWCVGVLQLIKHCEY